MKKRLLSLSLVAIMVFSLVPTAYAGQVKFKDLSSSHWAYNAVDKMTDKDIVTGYGDGSFKPNNTVTYAEFIKMAVVAATGEPLGASSEGHWASNFYNKGLEEGYFDRTDIPYTKLGSNIPRTDMALVLSNILGDKTIENYEALEDALTDIKASTKNEYHIKKVYAEGIISGYTDGTFKPEKTLNRAEAASVIYRLIDESARVIPNREEEEEEELIPEVEEQQKTYRINNPNTEGHYWEYPYYEAKLGDYGINDFEISWGDEILVKSSVAYEAAPLVINNNQQDFAGNVDWTNYWVRDGYYIYDDYIQDYTHECHPILKLKVNGESICVEFTDVTISKVADGQYKIIKH